MKKIVLASNSPRRIEMMKKYVDIINYTPDIVERVNSLDYSQTTVMKVDF